MGYARLHRLRQGQDGRNELVISSLAHGLTGIDPHTGKQLWVAENLFTLTAIARGSLFIRTFTHLMRVGP